MGNTLPRDSRSPKAHSCRATFALAMLIASFASAQPIQPVEMGAFPLRERIAAIDKEFDTLAQSLRSPKASAERESGLRHRLDALTAEKQKLEAELREIERLRNSPLVQFQSPAQEAK